MTIPTEDHATTIAALEYVAGQNLRASHQILTLLERAKANVEDLLNRLPDIFVIIDSKGVIWKGNQVAADFLEVGREELTKIHLSRLFESDTWKVMKTKIDLFLNSHDQEESIEFELPLKIPNAAAREFLWNFRFYEISSQAKLRLICVFGRDVSQIRTYQRQMSQIFFSIPLGILTIDQSGTVVGPYSAFTEHLLGENKLTGKSLFKLLFEPSRIDLSKAQKDSIKTFIDCLGADETWFNSMKSHFPGDIPYLAEDAELADKRWLGLSYHPICHGEKVEKVLLIMEDRTSSVLARTAEERHRSKEEAMVQLILEITQCDQKLLPVIMEELEQLLNRLERDYKKLDMRAFSHTLHATKGVARTAGFTVLKRLAHEIEDILSHLRTKQLDPQDEAKIAGRHLELQMEWTQLKTLYKALTSHGTVAAKGDPQAAETVSTFVEELKQAFLQPLMRVLPELSVPHQEMLRQHVDFMESLLWKYSNVPLSLLKRRLDYLVQQTAEQLHKDVSFKADLQEVRIAPERFRILTEMLSHLVNNALDHGLESQEERKNVGKPEVGTLMIRATLVEDKIEFQVQDDGKGLSPDGLRRIACKKKLISEEEAAAMSDEEALRLIFKPGFSSSHSVNDISGRGTGMDAAADLLRRLGGEQFEIFSETQRGTRFVFSIPHN